MGDVRDAPLIDAPQKIPNMPNGKRSFVGANLFARLCAEDGRINSPLRQSDRAKSVFMRIRMFELGVGIYGTSLTGIPLPSHNKPMTIRLFPSLRSRL